jgi:predicted nucleotidyltransferase component of viral defense system
MISQESLTAKWLDEVSKSNRHADKILIEKVIRALMLLEGLALSGLPFIFKGGTALMLLMNSAKRLSIDIDIILTNKPEKLTEFMNGVVMAKSFTRVELQHRIAKSRIEKAHYKFFYKPIHRTMAEEEYVLLDILFESNLYTNVKEHKIESAFLITSDEKVTVNIPSYEDLLGDKLTAFAPSTTGIPYFRDETSMSMEIIKQLFDIGNLFEVVDDLKVIIATFHKIAKTELAYRLLENVNVAKVLEDIYQTSLCLTLRGADGIGEFDQLQQGITRLRDFIFYESYHLEKAIPHAAKAAYLARLIATRQKTIEKFINPTQIVDIAIEAPHNTRLNKLKKSNPEAFFYWWKATQSF